MIDWLIELIPFLAKYPFTNGTIIIVITSLLFLWKIESLSKKIDSTQKELAGSSQSILSRLLFPLCTALPNLVFAYSAIQSDSKEYLVITSNVGNNVTNITLFSGLILLIGYIKGESIKSKESIGLRKEFNFLLISTIIFFACIWDNNLTRQEGIILCCCFFYSMADVFKFQIKDLVIIFKILMQLVPFFLVCGLLIFLGSELIIRKLEAMNTSSNFFYEVLLPGFVLVLPSILPLVLTITKQDMQKLALAGIIGDCAFSIPLIIGIISLFRESIQLPSSSFIYYLLTTSIISFAAFNFATSGEGKNKLWRVLAPFAGYIAILIISAKGN